VIPAGKQSVRNIGTWLEIFRRKRSVSMREPSRWNNRLLVGIPIQLLINLKQQKDIDLCLSMKKMNVFNL